MNADFPALLNSSELPQFSPVWGTSVTGGESGAAGRTDFAVAVAAEGRRAGGRSILRRRWFSGRLPWGELAGTLLVAGYLAAAYGAVYRVLPGRLSADANIYLAQPLIWSGLALLAYLLWRRLPGHPVASPMLVGLALVAAAFQLSFLVLAGVLAGFGLSPYAGPAIFMLKNALYIVTLLAGLEMSRAYLLHSWGRINPALAFAAVALLMAAVNIPLSQFSFAGGREANLEAIGVWFLPNIAESVMATLLAAFGGPLVSFSYVLSLAAFEWFSPILPDLEWTVYAFVYTLGPVVAMVIVRDVYSSWTATPAEEEEEDSGRDLSPLWVVAGLVLVGALWLNAGMLGVRPAVVSGSSMQPTYSATDVVFTKEVEPEELVVGDIIRYDNNGVPIMHRIVAIPEELSPGIYAGEDGPIVLPEGSSGPVFITQGDGNNVTDEPIVAQQIEGKVVFSIPKLGWPAKVVKDFIAWLT